MTFVDLCSETELKVEYRGVPDNEEERTKEGWKRYYFEAIKQTFGFGARLLWGLSTVVFLGFFPPGFLCFFSLFFNVFSSVQHTTSCCKLIARVLEAKKTDEVWTMELFDLAPYF